ncbi:hypothetical protein Tco_0924379 [Tanacetum coccineum]|uniref:Uncharacterized protein n=1 Tax=Tanacetum coccineum TaxID=301880 RepID=A0ABQ5D3R1_9ASTR
MAVGRGIDEGYGHGRGQGHGFDRGNYYGVNHGVQFKNTSGYKKWQDKEKNEKAKHVVPPQASICTLPRV